MSNTEKLKKAIEFLRQNPEAKLYTIDKEMAEQLPADLKQRVVVETTEEFFRRW